MILKEINNTLILVWGHTLARISFLLIIFISLLLSIFFSIFSSIIIIISYLCGCVLSFCLVKYRFEVNFCLQRLVNYYHGKITPKKMFNNSCTICDNLNCNRHQNAPIKEPWKGVFITAELNSAVENFFNKILENYISSWYKSFTDDLSFVNELRFSVRYATSCLALRYLDLDIGCIITNKLIPCAIRHIDDCIQIQEKAEKNHLKIEQAAISYLGSRIHVAATNRDNELKYLRNLTESILPKILTKSQINCKSFNILIREIISGWVLLPLMDVISDPNTFNFLVNITMTYKRKPTKNIINEKVELLYNFVNFKDLKKAALGYELTKIFSQPESLYAFMQFLKEEGPVNILQFCLDVEEFNKKLLTPDLAKKDLENLHSEATQLYNIYLKDDSSDYIGCSKDISQHFEVLIQGGPTSITKLRTSTPLYKAYDFAFNILETQWLPIFFHSDEFYSVVCGSKITSVYNKSPNSRFLAQTQGSPKKDRSNKKPSENNSGPVSKFSSGLSKIKSTLRTQPIEGSVYQSEPQSFESEPPMFIEENIYRDLSTWRVSITYTEQDQFYDCWVWMKKHKRHMTALEMRYLQDFQGSKPITIFYINIKRIDSCSESERYWTVQRMDQDFYTLKIKLVEFHGENEICDSPLPSRRLSTPAELRRQKYEEFLQKLLQKSTLRGSDLLYTFLTTKENFTLLADNSVPIVSDLENIYQSVAHKLRKEKGQYLDSFMNTFLMSTETSKINKFENPDIGEEADSGIIFEKTVHKPRNIKNTVFENNFGINIPETIEYTRSVVIPQDIIECSYYLLRNIFHAPKGVLQLFTAISSVASQAIESLSKYLIEREIKNNLSEHTLAHLITLLQETLFEHKIEPSTSVELEQRRKSAFNHFTKMNRGFFPYWLGLEVNEGLTTLLQILQHPQLNKQLAYSVLDILVLELFPDCNLT